MTIQYCYYYFKDFKLLFLIIYFNFIVNFLIYPYKSFSQLGLKFFYFEGQELFLYTIYIIFLQLFLNQGGQQPPLA